MFLILLVFSAGLAQYSGDPKTEWHLKDHPTKESLLDAIANLPYKGGNTMTGDSTALCPIHTMFKLIKDCQIWEPMHFL